MERLRKRIQGMQRELRAPKEATLPAEGAMNAALVYAHDNPPEAPQPEKCDMPEFSPDLGPWEDLSRE